MRFTEVLRIAGKVSGLLREDGVPVALDGNALNRDTAELMAWIAENPTAFDLTDKQPDPPPPDPDLDAITAILDKPDANITAADIKTALLKYLRRKRVQGAL